MKFFICFGRLSLCVLMLVAGLNANTGHAFGTIASVDEADQSVTILIECGNRVGGNAFERKRYPVGGKTRHGKRFWLLDGKLVSWQEAAMVGRPVTVLNHQGFLVSSQVRGFEDFTAKHDPNNAIYLVRKGWRLRQRMEQFDAKTKQWNPQPRRQPNGEIMILLDVQAGKLVDAVLVWNGLSRPWYPVRIEGFSLQGKGLQGRAHCALDPNTGTWRLPEGRERLVLEYDCALDVGEDGSLSFKNTDGKVQPAGYVLSRPAQLPEHKRLWMRIGLLPAYSWDGFGFVFCDLNASGRSDTAGTLCMSKGIPIPAITGNSLQFDGQTLSGSVEVATKYWGPWQGRLRMQGKLFAGRWIFGHYTIHNADGTVRLHERFHAGIADARGPSLIGLSPAHKKLCQQYGQ